MKDDGGDLFRRGLWFAGGCAAVGAVLILRTLGGPTMPEWTAWTMLVLGVLIVPAATETGYYNVDLALGGLSSAASVLGLLLFAIGWLLGSGMTEFLDLGPIFAFVGFATGAVCNFTMWRDVLNDLTEIAKDKAQREQQLDPDYTGPRKVCPGCGRQIPAYAGACQFCKAILIK